MKQHTNKHLRRALALFMTVLMAMSCFSATFGVISFAASSEPIPTQPSDYLLGKYFSNDWVWYDAVTGHNQLGWQVNGYPEYQSATGMTYLNNLYLKINTWNLFSEVNENTGVTFSYTYTPQIGDNHRHILSLGKNEYSGSGSNANDHFYISATKSWMGGEVPFVGFKNGTTECINARPVDGSPTFSVGTTYNVVVTISATDGVKFNINGTDYDAVYYDSNFAAQKNNIITLLNALAGYQYNYIGVSRWGDGYFTGAIKDLCIYGKAYTKAQLDNPDVTYSSEFISEAKTNFDVSALNKANISFDAKPSHENDPIDEYANYVYASGTSWSGDGLNNAGWGVGRTSFKVAVPGENVLVKYNSSDVIAPVTLESWSNDTGGQSQIIKYVATNTDLFSLQQNWAGYSSTWNVWAKNHIATAESFSHLRDTDPESPATQRDGASRFWWNTLKYNGNGNTLTYFDADYNISYHARTAYRNSASTSHEFREGDVTSKSNYYVINYKPIYDILDDAVALYNNQIAGQEWKYTDASLNQAMTALYLIQCSNPNGYAYATNAKAAVRSCAATIKQALAEYAKINLIKKTGTVTFNYEDNTEYLSITRDYGDTFTVPAVPTKENTAQYNYTDPAWSPAITAGATPVMSDSYAGQTFTATYTPVLRSYDITWSYQNAGGAQTATESYEYGQTPTAPAVATGDYVLGRTQYNFNGWNETPSPVTGAKTYIAQYTETELPAAAATMYANDINSGVYQNVISYTIYNLTTGSSFNGDTCGNGVVQYSESYDSQAGQTVYRKSWQANDTTSRSTGTLLVDRSKYDDIFDTGIYVKARFIAGAPNTNRARYGLELFDGTGSDKGALGDSAAQVTLTDSSGGSYTYKLCDSSGTEIGSAPYGSMTQPTSPGQHDSEWHIKGAAPAVGESVTLRVLAICAANAYEQNLQMLSEWTDITITGYCSHEDGNGDSTYVTTVTDPTCDAQGYTTHTCSVCGNSYKDSYTDALGHDYQFSSFTWSDHAATANLVCSRNTAHTTTAVAAVTPTDHAATYATGAYMTYTATYGANTDVEEYTVPIDKTKLQADINSYQEMANDEAQYTAESREALQTAIDAAQNVLNRTTVDVIDPVTEEAITLIVSDFETARDNMATAAAALVKRTYTITWNYKNADGNQTATTTVEYGATPTAPEEATGNYETVSTAYTFNGWGEALVAVTGEKTYTATYTEATKAYPVTITAGANTTLTVKNGDATVNSGDEVPYGTELTIEAAADAAYTQHGVTVKVNGEAFTGTTYTVTGVTSISTEDIAEENINKYTVIWKNGDTVLETDTNVAHGTKPAYNGETPTKANAQYTYTFTGWDGDINALVTDNVTFNAVFDEEHPTTNTYTVTFKGLNGETLGEAQTVEYGSAATAPTLPTKAPDAAGHYTVGWDKTFDNITEDTVVTAVASEPIEHTFTASWTWADDASAATVELTCNCGYSETQSGTVSQKSHTDGTCLVKETTVYTAVYGAYTAPDKTVEGDYGDHVYNEQYDNLIRPVKDANGTWSDGTKIWYCQTVGGTSNDGHNKTASVARADYDVFDALIAKVQGYLEQDITDEFRTAINSVLDMDGIKNLPDNLIVDEQAQVDTAVAILNEAYAQAKVGGILDEDGNITDNGYKHYTITFVTDGSAVENINDKKKGDEITLPDTAKDGFHFEGWYTDENHADGTKAADPYTVTGDATLYAFFEELSLNGDDVEAAITAATAGVSGICYTEESYTAYTNAVATVRAFKDQSATTENLTAYNNALAALDAAVAGLVAEHVYTGEPAITRPVYDEATGTWSKGVKAWTCANNADHPVKTEEVDRADYTTYDNVLEQISNLLDEDLLDDVKTALETAKTALKAIPQDYIVDEQETLDNAIQAILNTLNTNDKIDVDENNNITVDPDTAYKTYTLKLTNNVNTDYMEFTQKAGTTARLNPGLAGYTLQGFSANANYNAETGIYTFPQADDTITALFVKDLTDNETIENAQQIIADETNPDSGKDYDDDYIDELSDLLDDINAIKDDPTKLDELNEKLEELQALVDKAEENRAYTITWSIDGAQTAVVYKVGTMPAHEDPTKEGFRFTGWDPAIAAVTADATYTAVFTEISAEPADYTEYDALFEKLGTVVTNDVITDELKQEAQDKLDHPLARDLTADQQQIIDDEVAAIKAILDKIFEKDGNGDYTDTVKDSAAIHCSVVFHWLDVTLTKTVVKGSGVSAPNVTAMYGVEGEATGHYVFDEWDKDFSNVTEDIDVYGSYKLADHTGPWIDHPATCSHVAYTEITCTTCGLHFTKNTGTEKADHDWNDWVESPATCAHPGSRTRTCKNDATHTEFEVIPQLAHTDANGDTICDVCGNPTENHQHTDVNGDGKCDTCGAKTNAHVHNYQNGVCTGCGQTQDGSFRCNMCPVWERYRSIPVAGWILTAIHFFYHLICQIVSWR